MESLKTEQQRLGDTRHADEVARAQQRWKIDQLRQRALEELGTDPDVLVEEYGPHQLVPPSPPAPGDPEPQRRRSRGPTSAPSRTSGAARPNGRWPSWGR